MRYRRWLYGVQGHETDFLQEPHHGMILGGERFVEWLREEFGLGAEEEVPRKRWLRSESIPV